MQRSGERHVSAKGLAQTRVHSEAREAPAPDLTLCQLLYEAIRSSRQGSDAHDSVQRLSS